MVVVYTLNLFFTPLIYFTKIYTYKNKYKKVTWKTTDRPTPVE